MGKVKALFFDNDGTLVNTEPIFFEATKKTYATVGVELTDEWYIHGSLAKGVSSAELLRKAGFSQTEIEGIRGKRDELYRELLGRGVPVIEGVAETLEKLQGHFTMGVVTSSWRNEFDMMMDMTGLGKFFSFSITANDVANVKPHPEPYLKAVELVQQPKESCVVIEDSLRGVQAGKAAGLTSFAIPDALTKANDFSIADKVLGSITEVPALIGL